MKQDGGLAFPAPGNTWRPGMSLRDYFAGQALAGIAGHLSGPEKRGSETAPQAHARWAYAAADAMLAERAK